MKRIYVLGAAALVLAGCAAAPKRPSTRAPSAATPEQLAAAVQSEARRSEDEHDPHARAALSDQASADAAACLAQAPQAAACHYANALALGLSAREHAASAGAILKEMLASLARADAADPNYDSAGPQRVRALVLLRAPPWPLGPGDVQEALVAAQRAVARRPEYPPNLLALAQAQAATADPKAARATYTRARDAALTQPPGAERDGWVGEADKGLESLRDRG
jgi:hypothetical protein